MENDEQYYQREKVLLEYLAFHYPDPDADPLRALLGERTPPIEERFPFAVRDLWEPRADGIALDVGAAVGRVTFDLAEDHAYAIGLDLSSMLMRGAQRVQREGCARYSTILEGELRVEHEVTVPAPSNASFMVGDALHLAFPDGSFDTVVALNLIDRVPDPMRALDELARVTAPGGRLIIGSPFTWLPAFTDRDRWLGGVVRNGEPVRGIETVRARFGHGFKILSERRMPFYIPHHARTGQLGVACLFTMRRER